MITNEIARSALLAAGYSRAEVDAYFAARETPPDKPEATDTLLVSAQAALTGILASHAANAGTRPDDEFVAQRAWRLAQHLADTRPK